MKKQAKFIQFRENILKVLDKKKEEIIDSDNAKALEKHEKLCVYFIDLCNQRLAEYESKNNSDDNTSMYECIFTFEMMKNPCTTISGYSYEKEHLYKYLQRDVKDPISRTVVTYDKIYPNIALQKAITYRIASSNIQ